MRVSDGNGYPEPGQARILFANGTKLQAEPGALSMTAKRAEAVSIVSSDTSCQHACDFAGAVNLVANRGLMARFGHFFIC